MRNRKSILRVRRSFYFVSINVSNLARKFFPGGQKLTCRPVRFDAENGQKPFRIEFITLRNSRDCKTSAELPVFISNLIFSRRYRVRISFLHLETLVLSMVTAIAVFKCQRRFAKPVGYPPAKVNSNIKLTLCNDYVANRTSQYRIETS